MLQPDTELTVRLSREALKRLEKAARFYDVTVGAIVREALTQFLSGIPLPQEDDVLDESTDVPNDIIEAFRGAVAHSRTWDELREALKRFGLDLAPRGGGLALVSAETGRKVCKASRAGFGYSVLIKKFRSGFPGHPHEWLHQRVLSQGTTRTHPDDCAVNIVRASE